MSRRRIPPARGGAPPQIPESVTAIAEQIVRAAQPLQLILFGSQARGDTHRWSDADFLVVVPKAEDRDRVWDQIRTALGGSRVPYDLVVSTVDEVRRRGDLVGTVLRPALREGRVLYDAAAPAAWSRTGRAVKLEVGPVSEEDRLEQTRLWIRQARTDLVLADMVLASGQVDPDPACYHAQQAAEKALKAVLVFLQVQYPFTHELDAIREHLPLGWAVRAEFRNLKKLSDWSFKARYPGGWAPPTRADATEATRLARAIYESALRDLQAHGFPQEDSG